MKRQDDWQSDLKIATPTDFSNSDTSAASIGTIVGLKPVGKGDALTYTILGAWDSDPDKGIITYLSDRGNEILDKKVGAKVVFSGGKGKDDEEYTIASIKAFNQG